MRIVDAHVHLWDPTRMSYAWLTGSDLDHVVDARSLQDAAGTVEEFVVVQADCADDEGLTEVGWLSEQATALPGLRGIVAHAPLERGRQVGRMLRILHDHRLVVGVRRLVQDEPPGFLSRRDFLDGLEALGETGLPFDICARSWQLAEVVDLVRRLPGVRFVLDHLGKPRIAEHTADWREQMMALAELPNIVCKLSGLMTEIADGPRETGKVEPFLRHALDVFGPHRCLFGSDWPVMTLATTYSGWLTTVMAVVTDATDRDAVFHGTAEQVYQLPELPRRT